MDCMYMADWFYNYRCLALARRMRSALSLLFACYFHCSICSSTARKQRGTRVQRRRFGHGRSLSQKQRCQYRQHWILDSFRCRANLSRSLRSRWYVHTFTVIWLLLAQTGKQVPALVSQSSGRRARHPAHQRVGHSRRSPAARRRDHQN